MKIDIDEPLQPTATAVGHTFLRVVVGLVSVLRGWDTLMHLGAFQDQLLRLALPHAELMALLALALELVVGAFLIVGRMTRFVAFALLCDALAAAGLLQLTQPWLTPPQLESLALLASVAMYFVAAGGGRFSLDRLLHARARDRAIAEDDIWQRPPYVSGDASEVSEVSEPSESSYSTQRMKAVSRRRRWFAS
jgi:putative oxidoreductase